MGLGCRGTPEFASSPLVFGYNPHEQVRESAQDQAVVQGNRSNRGSCIGRTDPTTDPKGVLADMALDRAAKQHKLPGLRILATEIE